MSTIQWFPGHMTRAKRQLEEKVSQVDMVIELRDARAPRASANPILLDIIGNKPHIILLAKKDLADPKITNMWVDGLREEGKLAFAVDIINDNVKGILINTVNKAMKAEHERQRSRGIRPRATRALIVGIPNVGKSTLINSLANRKVASTANKPGLTRALKLIKVSESLEVIDSPGMLWPKFEDQEVGLHLGLMGSINEDVLPIEALVEYAYPILKDAKMIDLEADQYLDGMLEYAEKYNYYINGEFDVHRAYHSFLRELKNGEYGKISWERYDD